MKRLLSSSNWISTCNLPSAIALNTPSSLWYTIARLCEAHGAGSDSNDDQIDDTTTCYCLSYFAPFKSSPDDDDDDPFSLPTCVMCVPIQLMGVLVLSF